MWSRPLKTGVSLQERTGRTTPQSVKPRVLSRGAPETRQVRVLRQSPYVARFQLCDTSTIDRVNIFTCQAGRIGQSVYICVFGMDGLAEGTPAA